MNEENKSNEQNFIEEIQKDFLDEATFLLEQCEESYLKLEKPENRQEELGKIFRVAHSIKGAGASVGFSDLSEFGHVVEDCLSILRTNPEWVNGDIISLLLKSCDAFRTRINLLRSKSDELWDVSALKAEINNTIAKLSNLEEFKETIPQGPQKLQTEVTQAISKTHSSSVKVDTDRIDAVLDMVGELVVLKSQLMNETQTYQSNLKLHALVSLIEKSIRDLQDKALGMRMTPLKTLFLKTQRLVRDLSVKLEKQVDLKISGEETEIDRTMVELLSDPLMHIIRNALDHGIECSDIRQSHGKSAKGTIELSAQQMGGRILIKISDDGAGINCKKVLEKAKDRNLIQSNQADSLTEQEIYQLIFAPGFSTADTVTEVSGRGVGMDVVKTNIEKLKGTIDITSHETKGTSFVISIPLTTSITDGLQIKSSDQPYILPLDGIRELVNYNSEQVTEMHSGQEVLNIRGKMIPVVDLDKVLGESDMPLSSTGGVESKTIVVVETSVGLLAVRVQAVLGQVQVVLKSLGEYFSSSQGIAGAAILGDGKIALVLDVDHFDTIHAAVA